MQCKSSFQQLLLQVWPNFFCLYSLLIYIAAKNLVLDLILALQTLPTARLLPSPNNRGTLFGDLSRFNAVVDSDDFDIKSVILLGPMLQTVILVTRYMPMRYI